MQQRNYSHMPFSGYMDVQPKVLLNRLEVSIPPEGRSPPGMLRRFSPGQKLSPSSGPMPPFEMRLSPASFVGERRPSPVPLSSLSPMSVHLERRPSPAHMPERTSPMPMTGGSCTPPPAHGAMKHHKASPSVFVGSADTPAERKASSPVFGADTRLLQGGTVQRSSLSPGSHLPAEKLRLSPIPGERKLSPSPLKAHLLRAVPESERKSPSRGTDNVEYRPSPFLASMSDIRPTASPARFTQGTELYRPEAMGHTMIRVSPVHGHSPSRPVDQHHEGVRIHVPQASLPTHAPIVRISPSEIPHHMTSPPGTYIGSERQPELLVRPLHRPTPALPHIITSPPRGAPVPGKPLLSAHLGGAPFVPHGAIHAPNPADAPPRPAFISQGLVMHAHPAPRLTASHGIVVPASQPLPHPTQHHLPVKSSQADTFSTQPPSSHPALTSQTQPHGLKSQPLLVRKAMSDMTPFRSSHKPAEDSDGEGMPKLTPEGLWPREMAPSRQVLDTTESESHTAPEPAMVTMKNPFNMRVQTLNNFPTSSVNYRSSYRSQSVAMHRARCSCITSAAKSLDILRQNLQKSINQEIDEIVQKYMEKFFQPGIENIRINNGPNSVSEEHIHAVSRQILEEAKKMYTVERPRSTTPVRDIPDNVSDTGSSSGRIRIPSRKRRTSETDSEVSLPLKKKRKGRPPLNSSGRGTPSKPFKSHSPVRREGPKWEADRLKTDTMFVMGARANKALGLGATRGRLYIKHPDVFKYSGDQDDKQWLFDNHHMPATGGKAYMLVVDDIRELASSEEYRDSPNLLLDEILGFTVPEWMLEKMKLQMAAMRTDMPKAKTPSRSRSGTPDTRTPTGVVSVAREKLPFSAFSHKLEVKAEPSPSNTEEMEIMSTGDHDDTNPGDMSPLHMGTGFDDVNSDLDGLDEAPFLSQ